jgi:hypothetical protein
MFYSNPPRRASPQFAGHPTPQPPASWERTETPSLSAASCQRLRGAGCADGAVSRRKRSRAAAIAAASSGDALAVAIRILGRGGLPLPFRATLAV